MEVARTFDLAEGTVRSIKRNKTKISEPANCVLSNIRAQTSCPRHPLIQQTETHLYTWITDRRRNGVPLSTGLIVSKAKSSYEDSSRTYDGAIPKFNFSSGWFSFYKKR